MKDILLQHHKSTGFTLVEVLIVLAVSGIILSSVFMILKSQQDSYLAQDQVVEMQENIRAGMGIMLQELRMAGYDPYCSGNVGIEAAASNIVSFTLVADETTGATTTITFDLYDADGDGDMDIGRQEGADAKAAIAENIEALEFRYLDAGNNPVADLDNDLDKIANLEISVLARSGQPDNQIIDNNTYTSASGVVWGPYNDNVRRRFQIISINLRNMDT